MAAHILPLGVFTWFDLIEYFRGVCGSAALPSKSYLIELNVKKLVKCLKNCRIFTTGCLEKGDLLEAAEKQRRHVGNLNELERLRLFGLADALWKVCTVETTMEAIDIFKMFNPANNEDALEVRFMLLEIYIEMGMYAAVISLMECFPNDYVAQWFWTAPLLHFKKKGPESNSAKRALKDAVRQNPYVVKYLSGRVILTNRDIPRTCGRVKLEKTRGEEDEAQRYVFVFRRFWMKIKGSMEWVEDLGGRYLVEIKKENIDKSKGAESKAAGGEPVVGSLKIPIITLNCHVCKKVDVDIQKCGECKRVGYCSRQCQKKDWRKHRKECAHLKSQGEHSEKAP